MDVNKLRTPEGLNQYLNKEIRTLPIKLPDFMLQIFLWQKVKFDFTYNEEIAERLFEDKDKNILAIKTTEATTILLIGYLHIPDDLHIKTPSYSKIISDKAKELATELSKVAIKNNWKDSQIFIISTFRLSSYKKNDLSQFPNKAKYFYLVNSADDRDKFYNLAKDTETNEFMESDILLKSLLKRREMNNTKPEFWNCEICGGNNEKGCLYFDPTECPKFS
ncbi:hypothetical protein [Algoriphagus marinus]|uniref:hypothetical protein n=1 Tax=Algoriphagus marinus TaxID=1925762 RepID=UPI00094B8A20|nr:hypothetical protein [Algoriphagus marinus]